MRSVSATIGRPRFPKIQIMNACVPNFPSVAWPASERNRTLPQGGNQPMTVSQSVRSRPPGAARRGVHPALTLTVIAGAQLMVVLDATIVNIALPHIQSALHFSTTSLSWVLNAYTLTFGGLLLLGGRAGDILGRRRVFIFGILLFSLDSLLGGLATSSGWLLAGRHPARGGLPVVHHRLGAPARQVRPRRGADLDGWNGRPGLRVHPRGPGGLERHADDRRVRRRGGAAGGVPVHRDQDQAADHPAAHVPQPQPGRLLRDHVRAGSGAVRDVLLPDPVRAERAGLQPAARRAGVPAGHRGADRDLADRLADAAEVRAAAPDGNGRPAGRRRARLAVAGVGHQRLPRRDPRADGGVRAGDGPAVRAADDRGGLGGLPRGV